MVERRLVCRHTEYVADSTVHQPTEPVAESEPSHSAGRSPVTPFPATRDLNDKLLLDLIDAVKGILRKESADRLRDVYLIGDIEKDVARSVTKQNSPPMSGSPVTPHGGVLGVWTDATPSRRMRQTHECNQGSGARRGGAAVSLQAY